MKSYALFLKNVFGVFEKANGFLQKLVNKLNEEEKENFHKTVKDYFTNGVGYLTKYCLLDDPTLVNAAEANPSSKLESKFSSLQYFVDKFSSLLPVQDDKGQYECSAYTVLKLAVVKLDQKEEKTICSYWFRLGKIQNLSGRVFSPGAF